MFSSEDLELFFTYGHRRSCSIMQRNSIEDAEITKKMEELLEYLAMELKTGCTDLSLQL